MARSRKRKRARVTLSPWDPAEPIDVDTQRGFENESKRLGDKARLRAAELERKVKRLEKALDKKHQRPAKKLPNAVLREVWQLTAALPSHERVSAMLDRLASRGISISEQGLRKRLDTAKLRPKKQPR